MGKLIRLITKGESYDLIPSKDEVLEYQVEMNTAISRELDKLWKKGDMIELAGQITCAVTAIHGDYDPRPAAAVGKSLTGIIKDFKFILLEKCGHYPWLEKYARGRFYEILRKEIS
jgi:pimeloyl-ACP methyl ester carboxylesterase